MFDIGGTVDGAARVRFDGDPAVVADFAVTEPASAAGGFNLARLEVLVERRAAEFAERADEWRCHLLYLRDYADDDGRLPEWFDDLVAEVFEPLLASSRARAVASPDDAQDVPERRAPRVL